MERRRGARIVARFWIQVSGLDDTPKPRRGDISISGLFANFDRAPGPLGSVQQLTVWTEDRGHHVQLLARPIRLITVEDLWNGAMVTGAAMEFLFDDASKRAALDEFIRAVLDLQLAPEEDLQVRCTFEARLRLDADPQAHGARVYHLGRNRMVLSTDLPLGLGQQVLCEVVAPASKQVLNLSGEVVRTSRNPGLPGTLGYECELVLKGDSLGPHGPGPSSLDGLGSSAPSAGTAVDRLLEEGLFYQDPAAVSPPKENLRGGLSMIALPNLLAFLELEGVSGVLKLRQGRSEGRIFLNQGQVLDAESDGTGGEPTTKGRDALRRMLRWQDGSFELAKQAVDRKDHFQVGTGALILDLVREMDEAAR